MRLKLCRLSNVFNPSFLRSFIILFVVIMLGTVCFGFRWDFVVSGISVLVLYSFLFPLLNYPKYLELNDREIHYTSPETLLKRGRGFFNVTVKYHVSDITYFALQQNKMERLFGVAHIVFEGKTTIDAGKHTDRLQPKSNHCVYGIIVKKHRHDISSFAQNLHLPNQ